jgi:hypothetical protein
MWHGTDLELFKCSVYCTRTYLNNRPSVLPCSSYSEYMRAAARPLVIAAGPGPYAPKPHEVRNHWHDGCCCQHHWCPAVEMPLNKLLEKHCIALRRTWVASYSSQGVSTISTTVTATAHGSGRACHRVRLLCRCMDPWMLLEGPISSLQATPPTGRLCARLLRLASA